MNMNFFKTTAAVLVIAVISFTGCKKDDDPVKVSYISMGGSTLTLTEGSSETLEVSITPADAENKAVTWKSYNTGVATVNDAGVVTAIAAGTTIVTVTAVDGGFTVQCTITVIAAATGVTLNKTEMALPKGQTVTLTATVVPDDADTTVEWTTDNPAVATVAGGVVTAVAEGTTTITVTVKGGAFKATCAVTILSEPGPMTMSTAKEGEVKLFMAGTGEAVIDWGDDSEPEKITLKTVFTAYPHTFSNVSLRTITIDGQNITHLACYRLQLTTLDVSKNTALWDLRCYNNQLTSLDVTKNTVLKELYCSENQLTSLDVTKNTALVELLCSENQLTSLDMTNNTALVLLACDRNLLTSLDVSKSAALTYLWCYYNRLTNLDVTKNTRLIDLNCSNNQLTSLDVTKNIGLKQHLDCSDNQLTSLDVSKNTVLGQLDCYDNQLTTLDVSKNTALVALNCRQNRLTTLDVSKNTALWDLRCYNNQLTSLDVSKNTALKELECSFNRLTTDGLNALFDTLHSKAGDKTINIGNNPGTAGCDRTIATNKGWTVKTW